MQSVKQPTGVKESTQSAAKDLLKQRHKNSIQAATRIIPASSLLEDPVEGARARVVEGIRAAAVPRRLSRDKCEAWAPLSEDSLVEAKAEALGFLRCSSGGKYELIELLH